MNYFEHVRAVHAHQDAVIKDAGTSLTFWTQGKDVIANE